LFIKKKFNRSLHVENTSGSTIDEKTSSGESITPIAKRNRCMSQKSESSLNNMTMLGVEVAIPTPPPNPTEHEQFYA
jgi:hypothetical protein